MYYFVYMTTNLVNGKKYIGQHTTSTIDDSYIGSGKTLKKAVKKYGKENFKREILDFANTKEELDEMEKRYIQQFDAVKNNNFYNINEGGVGRHNFTWDEESKLKLSNSLKQAYKEGRHAISIPKMTEESKQKLSKVMKEKFATGELISPCAGMYGELNPNYGNKWTEEQKKNFSDKLKADYESGKRVGIKWSKERKERISKLRKEKFASGEYVAKGLSGEKNPMFGKTKDLNPVFGTHKTDEQKKRIK